MFRALLSVTKMFRHIGPTAAGATDITPSAGVNCTGADGVLFTAAFGAITAGAVTSLQAEASNDDGVADAYATIAGTSVPVLDTHDGKLVCLDISRPPKAYVRCVVKRATQNAVLDLLTAQVYDFRTNPVTQGTDVAVSEIHVAKPLGTA
jgi:hypothetical protein